MTTSRSAATGSMRAEDHAYSAQRGLAEYPEQQRFDREQRAREEVSRSALGQSQALRAIGQQARDGVLELQDTTRGAARGAARTATSLVPPPLTQSRLVIHAVATRGCLLSVQRDLYENILQAGRQSADV